MELQKVADEKKIRVSNSFKAEVKPKAAGTDAKQKSAGAESNPKPENQKSNNVKG